MAAAGWIDISVPVTDGMVNWPGDGSVHVEQKMWIDRGDVCNLSTMSMSVHTGTHMDAPRHFLKHGGAIHTLSLDALIGPARVVALPGIKRIEAEHVAPLGLKAGDRVLFKTDNSAREWWRLPFDEKFVHLSAGASKVLADAKIALVGVDYLSVGAFDIDGPETHHILLGAEIVVVEGMNLTKTEPGHYELHCLPMLLEGSDGAPARALLRKTS